MELETGKGTDKEKVAANVLSLPFPELAPKVDPVFDDKGKEDMFVSLDAPKISEIVLSLKEDASSKNSRVIGVEHPVEDFLEMISARDVDSALIQMQSVVRNLVGGNGSNEAVDTAVRCLAALRAQCVVGNHVVWNSFLQSIKAEHLGGPRRDFWLRVVASRLTLIHGDENKESLVTKEEADRFLTSEPSDAEYARQFAVGMSVVVSLAADDKWEPGRMLSCLYCCFFSYLLFEAKVMFLGALELARVDKNAIYAGVVLP